jgi:DNA-directed RNA polymerase specialized sigma24 family protein
MTQAMVIAEKAEERKVLFMRLYQQAFPLVAKFVRERGGSFEEAKDVFQDALVIYYEKLATSNIVLQYSEASYIFGITKHLWGKKHKQHLQQLALDDSLAAIIADEEAATIAPNKLLDLLHSSGRKCMELLRAFYYDKLPMNKLAGLFGFSSERSATVQKYKCLEKVRDLVKEKSLTYEDFLA